MQASHLVQGRSNSILFDERGIYPCCKACNIYKAGNLLYYMKFLEKKLGVKKALKLRDELLEKAGKPFEITVEDYQRMEKKYKKKADKLLEKLGGKNDN